MEISEVTIGNVLTRTSGYLRTVSTHSLQPYRGCTFGNSLCGVGCYVQHNRYVTRGRQWGQFLEIRTNAAESYAEFFDRERSWAQRSSGIDPQCFSIFCSSATDPFVPQERTHRITHSVLSAMCRQPPDKLILQTHTDLVTTELDQLQALANLCELRVHVSIESDVDRLPGLPPPACSVQRRMLACRRLKERGIRTVVTMAPLLPVKDPKQFFRSLDDVADAVVIDHFIEGDGTRNGTRTLRTELPRAMEAVQAGSSRLEYRDQIVAAATECFRGAVGVGIDGFAGRYLIT